MSDYLEELYEQATSGIELAGDNFTSEINIDCRNVINILDVILRLKEDREEKDKTIQLLANALKEAADEIAMLEHDDWIEDNGYRELVEKYLNAL